MIDEVPVVDGARVDDHVGGAVSDGSADPVVLLDGREVPLAGDVDALLVPEPVGEMLAVRVMLGGGLDVGVPVPDAVLAVVPLTDMVLCGDPVSDGGALVEGAAVIEGLVVAAAEHVAVVDAVVVPIGVSVIDAV